MVYNPEIYEAIPHRPPFLWIDSVVSYDSDTIITEKFIPPDLDIFKGHYPDFPLMPGVLLCEAVFQTGALLITKILKDSGQTAKTAGLAPVLTRIKGAKFKKGVKPGDTIRMQVTLEENIGSAWFFKGKVMLGDKTAVKVDFGCTLTEAATPKNKP